MESYQVRKSVIHGTQWLTLDSVVLRKKSDLNSYILDDSISTNVQNEVREKHISGSHVVVQKCWEVRGKGGDENVLKSIVVVVAPATAGHSP